MKWKASIEPVFWGIHPDDAKAAMRAVCGRAIRDSSKPPHEILEKMLIASAINNPGTSINVKIKDAAGTALVGAFRTAAQLFRRTGLQIESSNTNKDNFVRNLVTILAELRAALAVYAPSAFCEVTGLP